MDLRVFKRGKTEAFIPVWEGQRALAMKGEEKVLTVHLRSVPYGEMQKWEEEYAKAGTDQDFKRAEKKRNELLAKYIDRIENLVDPTTGDFISLPGQLFDFIERMKSDSVNAIDSGINYLLTELFIAIQERARLEKGLAKNWCSSSDSQPTKQLGEEVSRGAEKSATSTEGTS